MSQFTAKPLILNISGNCSVNIFVAFCLFFALGALDQINSIYTISNGKKYSVFEQFPSQVN